MSKHTPGPWIAEPYGGLFHVFTADMRVMVCDSLNDKHNVPHVARMRGVGAGLTEETQEANARLIAAAPDLFDELKRSTAILVLLLSEIGATPLARLSEPVRGRIAANRAAWAKAEGR